MGGRMAPPPLVRSSYPLRFLGINDGAVWYPHAAPSTSFNPHWGYILPAVALLMGGGVNPHAAPFELVLGWSFPRRHRRWGAVWYPHTAPLNSLARLVHELPLLCPPPPVASIFSLHPVSVISSLIHLCYISSVIWIKFKNIKKWPVAQCTTANLRYLGRAP